VGLAFQRHGTGSPLLVLHGIGHRRQAWGAVLDWLVSQRDVILPDLPGHGESPPLVTSGRSVARVLLDEVVGLIDELGLDRPHVAGNSLGGLVALELAASGRAASVTAFSPAGFWTSAGELRYAIAVNKVMQAVGRLIEPLGPALSRSTAGKALIYALLVTRPSKVSAEQASGDMAGYLAAAPAINEILAAAAAASFRSSIPDGVPVTIAWGARDRLLFPRQALLAKVRLPQANVFMLPDCGHLPMMDNPRLVAEVLLHGSKTAAVPVHQPHEDGQLAPRADREPADRRADHALVREPMKAIRSLVIDPTVIAARSAGRRSGRRAVRRNAVGGRSLLGRRVAWDHRQPDRTRVLRRRAPAPGWLL
jgi:pimeloyl-ACP methyl ester carboxylesterase